MRLCPGPAAALVAGAHAAGCAGFRGGWESVACVTEPPPEGAARSGSPEEIRLPDPRLAATIDNRLRTYDTQVVFFALPLRSIRAGCTRRTVQPGRTRVFVTVTPEDSLTPIRFAPRRWKEGYS